MRTILGNFARALEGRYLVTEEHMPEGMAVIVRSLDGQVVTLRRFTHRQLQNRQLLELILTDVSSQLTANHISAAAGVAAPPANPVFHLMDDNASISHTQPASLAKRMDG